MASFVRYITVVGADAPAEDIYEIKKKKKKKRRISRWLRPMERGQRRLVQASDAYGKESRRRHDKSNRKRKNGFLRDSNLNQVRATREAMKKLFKF
ncbi:MAG: hypothetical protein AAGF11_22165 [Myxococcota bacterium]